MESQEQYVARWKAYKVSLQRKDGPKGYQGAESRREIVRHLGKPRPHNPWRAEVQNRDLDAFLILAGSKE